ncbi:MAG TPA: YhjD/YihY/BrkB family envelope integrity protein [Acidimicrobiales bacterium]
MADGRIARLRGRVTDGAEWAATTAWHPVVIARAAYERDRDIGGGLLAGAIAFRVFVWLAAFLLVGVSVLGFIDAAGADAAATLRDGGITAIAASEIAQAASDARRSRWLLLLAGLYALFSTSRTMVRALWTASAIAARRPITKPPIIKGVLAYNALILVLMATVSGAARLRDATPGPGLTITFASIAVFLGVTWLALRWLPGPEVEARELLPGAILLAVGLDAMHLVSTLYLPHRLERASETYGALGTAIVLLLWLYLFGRLIVAGGVLNATMREVREERDAQEAAP